MKTKEKSRLGLISGFLNNHLNTGGKQKTFDAFDFTYNSMFFQCKKCGSDYEKHRVGDFCIDCVQRAEFVKRERPDIVAQLRREVRV